MIQDVFGKRLNEMNFGNTKAQTNTQTDAQQDLAANG
jgi:hypothetical protein